MIDIAIQRMRTALGLSDRQKRKFLYENAARFLRLDPANTGVLGKPVSASAR